MFLQFFQNHGLFVVHFTITEIRDLTEKTNLTCKHETCKDFHQPVTKKAQDARNRHNTTSCLECDSAAWYVCREADRLSL